MMWIILACFGVLLVVAYIVYTMPDGSGKKRRKREKKEREAALEPAATERNWKEIAGRWEKNNNALLGDIEQSKMQEKKLLKDLEESKGRQTELMDKLSLEKGWREKEQANLDKAKAHEKDLKDQIIRTEKDLEHEHSLRLRAERELQEIKVKYEAVLEEKRAALTKTMSLETTVKQLTGDIKELRRSNEELKKKREDIQWVAKSEYDQLLKEYNKLKQ